MKQLILASALLLSLPVNANAEEPNFNNLFLGYESIEATGNTSGDALVIRREFSVFPSLAVSGEYTAGKFEQDVDQRAALLQGLVYVPDESLTLVFGAGWMAAEVETETLEADADGPVLSLEGRFRFSEKLGLILGIDRIDFGDDDKTNVLRASLLMSDGETPLDLVFSYEVTDNEGTSDDPETFGVGLRCNF